MNQLSVSNPLSLEVESELCTLAEDDLNIGETPKPNADIKPPTCVVARHKVDKCVDSKFHVIAKHELNEGVEPNNSITTSCDSTEEEPPGHNEEVESDSEKENKTEAINFFRAFLIPVS